MASSSSSSFLPFSPFVLVLSICIFISLFSPSHSAFTCASPVFSSNRTFANCTKLPSLGATLHLTYNDTNRSLAVAFSAEPPKSGWVAWGINPQGGGMVGTQALLAYKDQNGKVSVHTYNLTSYKGIEMVKSLSFETWDLAAEESDDGITIFATLRLPEKADNLSQVWQVGPMNSGKPAMHEMKPENLQATQKFEVGTTAVGTGNTTSGGGGNSTTGGGNENSGGVRVNVMAEKFGLVVMVFMSFIIII